MARKPWRGPRWNRNNWCRTCRAYKVPLKWSAMFEAWFCYPHLAQRENEASRQLVAEIEMMEQSNGR